MPSARAWLISLLLVGAVLHGVGRCSSAARPFNLVLIVVDTLRADHLGCYGYDRGTSPRIDQLAARSVVFDRAYSHSPWTMPSIASILTGRSPVEHGARRWLQPLDDGRLTLAEHLRAQGYGTAAFVSHLLLRPRFGFAQGFDRYDESALGLGPPEAVVSSDHLTDGALAWLDTDREGNRPFFLWVHYFDPHFAYNAHDGFPYGEESLDRYDSEIAFTDAHIGRLLDGLAARRLDRRTIVVIVGDHGEEFLDHGGIRHGEKLYDELVRIPLVVHVPGFAPARVSTAFGERDLAPTLLSLMDLPLPPEFRGTPLPWRGGRFSPTEDRPVMLETFRSGDRHGIVDAGFKLIEDRRSGRRELYDLRADPREATDLAEREEATRDRLLARLGALESAAEPGPDAIREAPETVEQLRRLGYVEEAPESPPP